MLLVALSEVLHNLHSTDLMILLLFPFVVMVVFFGRGDDLLILASFFTVLLFVLITELNRHLNNAELVRGVLDVHRRLRNDDVV